MDHRPDAERLQPGGTRSDPGPCPNLLSQTTELLTDPLTTPKGDREQDPEPWWTLDLITDP